MNKINEQERHVMTRFIMTFVEDKDADAHSAKLRAMTDEELDHEHYKVFRSALNIADKVVASEVPSHVAQSIARLTLRFLETHTELLTLLASIDAV